MFPLSGTDVPEKAGSSSNTTSNHDRQWLSRLRDWKAPELKLSKVLRTASSKKSKKGKGIEIETVPKTESTPGHDSEEVNNLPLPNNAVAQSSPAPSVPQEAPFSSTSNLSPSVCDIFPWNVEPRLPLVQGSESHSSSSSEYGPSYRSRSSSGPSIYGGPDPSFPYPFRFESLESLLLQAKSDEPEPPERQSSGSWHSTSPPMPELNRPPSTDCGLFTLGINQFHAHSNAILKDFVKLGDREGAGQFLPEPDMNSSPEPVVQKTALDDIPAQRQAQPEMRERQSSGPAIWRLPPSTNRGFSGRDTDIPSLAEIKALHSRPRKGGAEIPPNPNSGPPMVQTKNVHDISARRQAAIANPFPFPFIEDSDDEIIIEVKSRSSVVTNVGTYNTGIPFSSPIIEDDWG